MATFTATADNSTNIRFDTYETVQWDQSDGACQGAYKYAGYSGEPELRRIGLIIFEGAGQALSGGNISEITLTTTAANAGYSNRTKTLYIRKSNYQTLQVDIPGSEYIGDLLGTLTGKFYGETTTYTLNATTNVALFENLRKYFKAGNSAITLFDEGNEYDSGIKYTYNYLRLSSCALTVTYEEAETEMSYLWCYVNGEWKACTPYYYTNGEWKQCVPWYRKDGTWTMV